MSVEEDARQAVPASTARRCPYCGRDSVAALRSAIWSGSRLAFVGPMGPVHERLVTGLYQCEACERAVMLLFEESESKLIGAWPRMRAHSNEALPPDVDADRVEAWNCFFGAEHRAATLMARAAFRRALRRLGAAETPSPDELHDLVAKGIVSDEAAGRAVEAGLAGTTSADELEPVTAEAAERTVSALDEFLAETFAPPAR